MKKKKKCFLFFVFVCCFIPILMFSLLAVIWEIKMRTLGAPQETNYCFDPCGSGYLQSPFGALGRHCESPLLQINCSISNSPNIHGLGYLYHNNITTDMLVTTFNSSSTYSSGDLSIVPHPSMSTCSHIRRANFSSVFQNLHSLSQFQLYAMHSSSLLFFNCSSPLAVREEEYPPGIYHGGEACTRFTQSCLNSNSSHDCFQLYNIQGRKSNHMEALIAKLGCTSFTSSSEHWDDNDFEKPWPSMNTDVDFVVGWQNLPNYNLCEHLDVYCCGHSPDGIFRRTCSIKHDQSWATPFILFFNTANPRPWAYPSLFILSLILSSFAIFVVMIVTCVVKRQSIMLCLTGERYFKVQDLHEPPKKMSYRLLDWATRSFTTKIGEGGFGQVYSGILPRHNTLIAVKVLDNARHSQGQFVAEVASIGNLHHLNLVRLIGFCSHKAKRLLVYEYIPNGSLDTHLFSANSNVLSWERRYSIIQGVARGLAYLHHECRQQVVHLDIKPQNVLLDLQFNPKIADFGLAKLMNINESKAQTAIRGTLGYLAPELWKDSTVSAKCDVYSFGVLTVEVIAGRKWLEIDTLSSQVHLTTWAFKKASTKDYLPILDQRVACPEIIEQAKNLILISMWCIQQDPCLRPSMVKVVEYIEGKDVVPSNPPNPFEATLNTEDPIPELSTNDSSSLSV